VSTGGFDAVLLLAFGGPTRPEEIRPFLDDVLRGRPVPPARYEAVVQHYLDVGGASPITRLTEAQAEGLRTRLLADGPDLPVFVGMRHWTPRIPETLAAMAERGLRRAVGIILAAHPSRGSRGGDRDAVAAARAGLGAGAPEVAFVDPFYAQPLFIEALAARLRATLDLVPAPRRGAATLLFTAHSIPVTMSEEAGYERALRDTATRVAAAAGAGAWRLVFQSRSGGPHEPWLEPDILAAIAGAAEAGARDVVVAPIGFVSDHVEVLYDLDIEARAAARRAGVVFHRAGTAGDHPAFLRMLALLVRDRVAGGGA
jgi:ferrochelatase